MTSIVELLGFIAIIVIVLLVVSFWRKSNKSQKTISPMETTSGIDLWDMGKAGERYTKDVLEPLQGYKQILSNCYFPKSDGTFTEVDLILLHESGIYVIESKNYSGWIFGHEDQQQWTQSLPGRNGQAKKVRFFNPIMQNKGHLKWMKKYADIRNDIPFYSFIVFSDRCELKKITLTSGNHFVVNRRNLFQKVQETAEGADCKLTRMEIDMLYKRLCPLTQVSEEQKAIHVEIVQQKKGSSPSTATETVGEKERICPRCGGKLVIRTVKRGERAGKQLWGCSNFPKCRFTENIEETESAHS